MLQEETFELHLLVSTSCLLEAQIQTWINNKYSGKSGYDVTPNSTRKKHETDMYFWSSSPIVLHEHLSSLSFETLHLHLI